MHLAQYDVHRWGPLNNSVKLDISLTVHHELIIY